MSKTTTFTIDTKQAAKAVQQIIKEETASRLKERLRPTVVKAIEDAINAHMAAPAFQKRLKKEAHAAAKTMLNDTPLNELMDDGYFSDRLWDAITDQLACSAVTITPNAYKSKKAKRRK